MIPQRFLHRLQRLGQRGMVRHPGEVQRQCVGRDASLGLDCDWDVPAAEAQGQGLDLPQYVEVARQGPDHAPRFTAEVRIKGTKPARGGGTQRGVM